MPVICNQNDVYVLRTTLSTIKDAKEDGPALALEVSKILLPKLSSNFGACNTGARVRRGVEYAAPVSDFFAARFSNACIHVLHVPFFAIARSSAFPFSIGAPCIIIAISSSDEEGIIVICMGQMPRSAYSVKAVRTESENLIMRGKFTPVFNTLQVDLFKAKRV